MQEIKVSPDAAASLLDLGVIQPGDWVLLDQLELVSGGSLVEQGRLENNTWERVTDVADSTKRTFGPVSWGEQFERQPTKLSRVQLRRAWYVPVECIKAWSPQQRME